MDLLENLTSNHKIFKTQQNKIAMNREIKFNDHAGMLEIIEEKIDRSQRLLDTAARMSQFYPPESSLKQLWEKRQDWLCNILIKWVKERDKITSL